MDDAFDRYAQLEQMLAAMLGPEAARQTVEQLRAIGIDPTHMPALPVGMMLSPQAMAHMQHVFADPGAVNTTAARELARTGARSGDHIVVATDANRLRRALAQADLWLDTVIDLTCDAPTHEVWNRETWVERTFDVWTRLAEPVAVNTTGAFATVVDEQLGQAGAAGFPGLPAGLPGGSDLVKKLGSALFGMQLGQAIGELAGEAFGSTDVGLALGGDQVVALVEPNVAQFAAELEVPLDEVEAFLAVREVAHARLFASAPWLTAQVIHAVRRYASGISIDLGAIDAMVRDVLSSGNFSPEALPEALAHSLVSEELTAEQEQALADVEVLLALIEGWVSEVSLAACLPYLRHTHPLAEMMRRRRAQGSPAEQVLQRLIGLRLRPKRARDAQALWAHLTGELGIVERDRLWSHPSRLPGAADLNDPAGFRDRREAQSSDEVDRELADLLGGTLGYAQGLAPGTESEGDETVTGA